MTNTCKQCGSDKLSWFHHNAVIPDIVQGRLKSEDIQCQFILGCDECSETIKVIRPAKIVEMLQASQPVAWHWKGPKGGFIADTTKPPWSAEPLYSLPPGAGAQLHAIVDAWEALPGGRDYSVTITQSWLTGTVAPAIQKIREFLGRERPKA